MTERNLLLVHDHRFPLSQGEGLNDGRFGDLRKYTSLFDSVTLLARSRVADAAERTTLPKLADALVDFKPTSLFGMLRSHPERRRVLALIRTSDAIVVRLPSVLGSLAFRWGKRLRKPVLVEMVGCPWDAYINHGLLGKLVAPMAFLVTRRQVRNAAYTLYVTERFLQDRYPTRGHSIGCSDVVLGESDRDTLERRVQDIERRPPDAPMRLATAAAVDVAYKGHAYVIAAIAALKAERKGVEYWVIGPGDQSRLRALAMEHGVLEEVRFLDALPHGEVLRTIQEEIDLYVQPSRQEGLPRAVLEAMSVACPAIGSRVGGIPELLDSACTFRGGDVKELAALIARLKPTDLKVMAVRNFEFVQQRYAADVLDERRTQFMRRFRASADESD